MPHCAFMKGLTLSWAIKDHSQLWFHSQVQLNKQVLGIPQFFVLQK